VGGAPGGAVLVSGGRRRQPAVSLHGGVVLRPWLVEDAAELAIAQRDPLVRRYAGRLIDDRTEALARIQGWARHWLDGVGAAWAVRGGGGELLGGIRYGVIDEEVGTGSVGYWLSPEGRGRGLATGAVRASTTVVFGRTGWFRIELYHAVENDRSCRVARNSGYRAEGVMRGAMLYPADARRSDEHLHARLVTDVE
jgi:ribosomal-protein-alanine N-acetyltransferase